MPLFARARIEVYLPDLPKIAYHELLTALDREFCYTFGGATIFRGLDGSYLSFSGAAIHDRVSLIYADIPFAFRSERELIARYADELKAAAFAALEEEAVLIAVIPVYHAG